jgi:hypothetical protein
MRRREFITLIGSAAAWPVEVRAQQPLTMRRIGALNTFVADDPEGQSRMAALLQALQPLGWTVGRNVRIDYRWGTGDTTTTRKNALELVALAPDVIVTSGAAGLAPLLDATRTVPIVFVLVGELNLSLCERAPNRTSVGVRRRTQPLPKPYSNCEEAREVLDHFIRHLLLDVMAALDRLVRDDIRCIAPPHVQELRSTLGGLAPCAPKHKQRHVDLPVLVGRVHLEIARRRGPIIAARAGDGFKRIAADVFIHRGVGQKASTGTTADRHAALDEIFRGYCANQALGKRFRLRHEPPMPSSDYPILRDICPHVIIGHDIHHTGFDDALRMVETQNVRSGHSIVVGGDAAQLLLP